MIDGLKATQSNELVDPGQINIFLKEKAHPNAGN